MEIHMLLVFSTTHLVATTLTPTPLSLAAYCNYLQMFALPYNTERCITKLLNLHATPKCSRGQLKCEGTRAENRFGLSTKRTSPFKSAWTSVQSTTGRRGVHISGSNAGYTMFRGSVKGTAYPLHSPVSLSLPLLGVTVCQHISTGVYCKLHLLLSIFYHTNRHRLSSCVVL
jgi:hypothetical protein